MVRSETDGYVESAISASDDEKKHIQSSSFDSSAILMQEGGKEIPQEAVFELKTRSTNRKKHYNFLDHVGKLWLTQTPKFILAYHEEGVFNDIEVKNIKPDVEKWESNNAAGLAWYADLIDRVVSFVRSSGAGWCEVRCRDEGVLELKAAGPDAGHALPVLLQQRWDD